MKLFAAVYLDEDVSVLVATLLQARGFDAVTARDEAMLTQPDPVQLAHATSSERYIHTHNRVDYKQLHRHHLPEGRSHFGIIISSQRSPYEIAAAWLSCSII